LDEKVKLLICLLPLVLAISASAKVPMVSATKTIHFKPSVYVFAPENASIGTLFNVSVWVSSDSYPYNLMMWEVYLEYNQTLINVTTYYSDYWGETSVYAWPNMDFGQRTFDPAYAFYGELGGMMTKPEYIFINSEIGAVLLGDLLMSDKSIDGEKLLCVIQFNITAEPPDGELWSALHINHSDTYLYDSNGQIEDVIIEDGEYLFIPEFGTLMALVGLTTSTITVIAKKYLKKK